MPAVALVLRRLSVVALAALAAAAAIAAPAPAADETCEQIQLEHRYVPDPFGTTGGQLILVPVCVDGPAAEPTPKPSPKPAPQAQPTPAQMRALRFRPTAAVSEDVRQRLIDRLAHGEHADALRQEIAAGRLMAEFRRGMRGQAHRWSPRDLGDVYAQVYVYPWLSVNGETQTSAAVDEAVRRDLRRRLALDPRVRRASDGEQQAIAEWLGSWAVVVIGAYQALRAVGDAEALERFRGEVRTLVREPDLLGVDLQAVRLTPRGIEPR
ncbi:MAG TPA: DUF6683 family protein [Capillimicrobium sp.]